MHVKVNLLLIMLNYSPNNVITIHRKIKRGDQEREKSVGTHVIIFVLEG